MINELETKENKIQAKDQIEPRHDSNLCICCRKNTLIPYKTKLVLHKCLEKLQEGK